MNKRRVDGWILKAKEALEKTGIAKKATEKDAEKAAEKAAEKDAEKAAEKAAEKGKSEIDNSFRGQISAFGAAMVMGSFRSAVAFYVEKGEAKVDRQKLLQAIYYVIYGKLEDPKQIFQHVCDHDSYNEKEKFIDASIALKLAMNFFERV